MKTINKAFLLIRQEEQELICGILSTLLLGDSLKRECCDSSPVARVQGALISAASAAQLPGAGEEELRARRPVATARQQQHLQLLGPPRRSPGVSPVLLLADLQAGTTSCSLTEAITALGPWSKLVLTMYVV